MEDEMISPRSALVDWRWRMSIDTDAAFRLTARLALAAALSSALANAISATPARAIERLSTTPFIERGGEISAPSAGRRLYGRLHQHSGDMNGVYPTREYHGLTYKVGIDFARIDQKNLYWGLFYGSALSEVENSYHNDDLLERKQVDYGLYLNVPIGQNGSVALKYTRREEAWSFSWGEEDRTYEVDPKISYPIYTIALKYRLGADGQYRFGAFFSPKTNGEEYWEQDAPFGVMRSGYGQRYKIALGYQKSSIALEAGFASENQNAESWTPKRKTFFVAGEALALASLSIGMSYSLTDADEFYEFRLLGYDQTDLAFEIASRIGQRIRGAIQLQIREVDYENSSRASSIRFGSLELAYVF